MNVPYTFQAEKFALSDEHLHLLRNGLNYKTIPVSTVTSIEIIDGKDLKNWWWVLFIGVVLSGYAFYDVLKILFMLGGKYYVSFHPRRLFIPLIPAALGLYSIRIALRNTRVMIVKAGSKRFYFSLREIILQNKFVEFLDYLKVVYPGFRNLSRF